MQYFLYVYLDGALMMYFPKMCRNLGQTYSISNLSQIWAGWDYYIALNFQVLFWLLQCKYTDIMYEDCIEHFKSKTNTKPGCFRQLRNPSQGIYSRRGCIVTLSTLRKSTQSVSHNVELQSDWQLNWYYRHNSFLTQIYNCYMWHFIQYYVRWLSAYFN